MAGRSLPKDLVVISLRVNTHTGKLFANRISAFVPKRDIIIACSALITMALNQNLNRRIGFQIIGNKQKA
jgi:hypothetical protein